MPEVQLGPEQRERMERMLALGYVSGSMPAPAAQGVVRYVPERAHRGLNLVVSGHAPAASLTDMAGEVLHTWRKEFAEVWPDSKRHFVDNRDRYWRRAHLFPEGDVLAIFEDAGLVKLDKDSNLIWKYSERAHHDLFVAADGTIYVLIRADTVIADVNPTAPVTEDFIAVLAPDGSERRRVSVYRAVKDSPYAFLLEHMARSGDLFHTNTIERVDERAPAGLDPGSLLISIHQLHTIGTVNLELGSMTWALTGGWRYQHQPTVLPNGHLLLFDNLGTPARSSVLEIDPASEQVVWRYQADAPAGFFSFSCGSAERLPNGNTLITESDNGRAFEVTAAKEIVWEYWSPHRAGKQNELIATLFEVVRLPADFGRGWLARGRDRGGGDAPR